MNDLLAWVTAAMVTLAPEAQVSDLALAITDVAERNPAPRRLAALLVSVAWFESRFHVGAVGDNGHSCGAFQSWVGPGETCERLRSDPYLAAERAVQQVHASLRACAHESPENRLAQYTSGSCSKGRPQARWRWWLANRLLREGEIGR